MSRIKNIEMKILFEEVELAAVKKNPKALYYIKNPSEKVQLAAVEEDGTAIRYIPKELRSEKVQLAAVKQDGTAIRYIKNPTEEVQKIVKSCYPVGRLPPKTECLITGDIIAEGERYKLCSVKHDHIISLKSWCNIGRDRNICCYCKGKLLNSVFQNAD